MFSCTLIIIKHLRNKLIIILQEVTLTDRLDVLKIYFEDKKLEPKGGLFLGKAAAGEPDERLFADRAPGHDAVQGLRI